MKDSVKLVANNKKAWHDYFIDDKIECGIELFGTEAVSYTHLGTVSCQREEVTG